MSLQNFKTGGDCKPNNNRKVKDFSLNHLGLPYASFAQSLGREAQLSLGIFLKPKPGLAVGKEESAKATCHRKLHST